MRHHAIIVTGQRAYNTQEVDHYELAHAKAVEFFGAQVSPMMPTVNNNFSSFFIGSDGSKEGWKDSDEGDARRATFVGYLRSASVSGAFLKWVEVQYGDEDDHNTVVNASGYGRDEETDEDWVGFGRK